MRILPRWLKSLAVCALSFQMVACGTILYPERKGQRDGRLDVGVVLLDGVGLLCFIIPGVIAYAVDFTNGTIYLPGTSARKAGIGPDGLRAVAFDARHRTPDSLKELIRKETGYAIDWRDPRLRMIELKSKDELPVLLSRALRQGPVRT